MLCRIYRKNNHDQARVNTRTDSTSCIDEVGQGSLNDQGQTQPIEPSNMGVQQLYNGMRPALPRLGSFGRLIMSGSSMPDSFLDGLVSNTDQIPSPSVNITNDSFNSWAQLAHLSSTIPNQAMSNISPSSLFTRETNHVNKCNSSTTTNNLGNVELMSSNNQTMGLNIGLPNILSPMHTSNHHQQLKDSSVDSNNASVENTHLDNHPLRWPFSEGRTRFSYHA